MQIIKKRFQRRCFPANNAKFLITAFFRKHLWWLLLLPVHANTNSLIGTITGLQHRCFPVCNAKFLRTVSFIKHVWWLLLLPVHINAIHYFSSLLALNFIKKDTLAQVFSCEFCEIFLQNTSSGCFC